MPVFGHGNYDFFDESAFGPHCHQSTQLALEILLLVQIDLKSS